jgi:capsular polysaccharide biosynthesis protein
LKSEKISNISVIQPASFVPKPVSPKKGLTLLVGFALSICGGFGVIGLSGYLDQSLSKPEDVEEKLRLPVLASIPRIPRRKIPVPYPVR